MSSTSSSKQNQTRCCVTCGNRRRMRRDLPNPHSIGPLKARVVTLFPGFNSIWQMAAYLPLAQPFEAFFPPSLSVYFTSDTVLEPTRNYRETRQRQCSGAISSVISLLWAPTHQREYQAVSKSQPLLPQAIITNPLTFTSQPLTNGRVCVRACACV